ncbi:MAG TPA: methyl-accepting chemotaxis protein [Pseudobdellovibrionaceae bacterium]|jgi:methyl-accepting chemotaxis protein
MLWIDHFGIRIKILLTVFMTCFICGGISLIISIHFNNKELHKGLMEKARTIHSRLDVAAKYVSSQGGLPPLIEKITQKYKDPSQILDEEKKIILQQVPIYAAMKIGAEGSETENYTFRVFSNEPRRKENLATLREMEVFKKFESTPDLKEWVEDNDQKVTVYRPVRLTESKGCFVCHGDPAKSPWGNGKDLLGYQMENWKEGKLHGVFAISSDLAAIKAAQAQAGVISSSTYLGIFIGVGALLALLLAAFTIRGPIQELQKLSGFLNESGGQINSTSQKIADSSQSLSESSTQQAVSLEETVSTVKELTSMVRLNTDNSKQSAILASAARESAEKGEREVHALIESIQNISTDSKRIEEITTIIDDIAFQTNLLALNAAVEAARAGEQGKGFAVVADAVRSLAQKSAAAAKDISELLKKSSERIEKGNHQANQGGLVLSEIVGAVRKVAELNNEIASASEEQSHGISQIGKAMTQLDQVTQQNASVSEEAAATAEELSSQSTNLRSNAELLEKIVRGTRKQMPRDL